MNSERTAPEPLRLALVGGGPTCTYVLERLAALTREIGVERPLEITVFDLSGEFGSGQVHSPGQTKTSYLNRIVGQVAFAADESVVDAGPLLPAVERPTLLEWCRARFEETGDPVFDLVAEDWPKRYLHGLALNDQFRRYLEILTRKPGVTVTLRQAEVVDLEDRGGLLTVVTADGADPLVADYVLLLTGHSANRPELNPRQKAWAEFATRHPVRLVPNAYPLEKALEPVSTGPGTSVGCLGMGLTGIDVLLYLTEGRGGRFERGADGRLEYRPCGAEPDVIVPFSRTGLFTFARPYNEKERDIANLEYRGRFLTIQAVHRLRSSAGRPNTISGLPQLQLDFEAHVLPLIILEMDLIYHSTLLGPEFRAEAIRLVEPAYQRFLSAPGAAGSWRAARDLLTEPIQRLATRLAEEIDRVLDGPGFAEGAIVDNVPLDSALAAFLTVVHGAEQAEKLLTERGEPEQFAAAVARAVSPWSHRMRATEHGFSWERTIDPLAGKSYRDAAEYREAFLEFLDADIRQASQGNLRNPAKAAADAAWRDLRGVVIEAVDFGGLLAGSHRTFLEVYTPHHNRLCQGASREAMEKVAALVRAGIVDVTAGPDARVAGDEALGRFAVEGPATGVRRPIDVLVDARVHSFDAERDVMAVYPNLLRRGLVRKWANPGLDEPDFVPGGLDLTRGFHPVRADGRVEERITVLGPPSEGVMYHQIGALRPNKDHHVIRDILAWMNAFLPHEAPGSHPAPTERRVETDA